MHRVLPALLMLLASPVVAEESQKAVGTDWTGFYLGVGLGASQHQIEPGDRGEPIGYISNPGPFGSIFFGRLETTRLGDIDMSLLAGYGAQIGSAFVGVEGMIDVADPVFADVTYYGFGNTCVGRVICATVDKSLSFDTLGRIRGVFGVVIAPTVMGFATAGVAIAAADAEVRSSVLVDGVTDQNSASASGLAAGITIGGGVDIKATDNLRVRVEGFVDSFAPWSYNEFTTASLLEQEAGVAGVDGPLVGEAGFANVSGRVSLIWQF